MFTLATLAFTVVLVLLSTVGNHHTFGGWDVGALIALGGVHLLARRLSVWVSDPYTTRAVSSGIYLASVRRLLADVCPFVH